MGFYFIDDASLRVPSSSRTPHSASVVFELMSNKLNSACCHKYGFGKYDSSFCMFYGLWFLERGLWTSPYRFGYVCIRTKVETKVQNEVSDLRCLVLSDMFR